MSIIHILVTMLAAIRVSLYMRCLRACVGQCRISPKIAVAAFTALWVFEGFILSISHIGQDSLIMEFFLLLVESPFLLVMSFCYRGGIWRRLLTAVFLPLIYWIGKWSVVFVLFSSIADGRQYLIVTAVSVALLGFFVLILEKAGKSRQERERELLEQEIRIYENQFDVIRQSQSNIRSLKHDMKHHIKMLADMISDGENELALRYLGSMGSFMENGEEYVASGNERIDSILNYMISKAKDNGVCVEWNIQIPEHLEISAFDINVILSNLLENALNALQYVSSPTLYIAMKYDRGVLCISTQNNHSIPRPIPDAADAHGFGLKNIRRIAEKYHGSLTTEAGQDFFHADVLLFLSEQ